MLMIPALSFGVAAFNPLDCFGVLCAVAFLAVALVAVFFGLPMIFLLYFVPVCVIRSYEQIIK
jgi:hypothetical protein